MDDETEQRARHLTELEAEYLRAPSKRFGPLSKEIAEETDALADRVAHPTRKGR